MRWLLIIPALIALTTPTHPQQQQAPCGPHDAITGHLRGKYQETPVGAGITDRQWYLEILASPRGTWTVIITAPGQPTCMMAAGDGWQAFEMKPIEEKL